MARVATRMFMIFFLSVIFSIVAVLLHALILDETVSGLALPDKYVAAPGSGFQALTLLGVFAGLLQETPGNGKTGRKGLTGGRVAPIIATRPRGRLAAMVRPDRTRKHVKKQLYKFGVVVVLAGAFTSIGIVVYDVVEQPRSGAGASPEALVEARNVGGGADFIKDVPLLVVAPEGQIELLDRPGTGSVARVLEQGSLVRVLESRVVDGQQWFLVALEEGGTQGWIATEDLRIEIVPAISVGDFRFCAGTVAGPTGPCGSELSIESDAIWLQWSYRGLSEGDTLQRVLVIGEERYATRPVTWQGPESGEQLVNLLSDHDPRREAGVWIVEFFVNNKIVGEASVWVR